MARPYKDRVTDSPDNQTLYQIVDETTGNVIVARAVLQPVNVIESGDQFGAMAANRLLALDDDGTPLLQLDGGTFSDKPGTIQLNRQNGSAAAPAKVLYSEPFVMRDGSLYIGDENGTPVPMGSKAAIHAVQDALANHEKRSDNPHKVSRDQIGAAAAADLKSHADNRSNPHKVTCSQIGAAPASDLTTHANNRNNPHGVSLTQLGGASSTDLSNHVRNTGNPHGVTAAQANAVSKSGDTMTGALTINAGNTNNALNLNTNSSFPVIMSLSKQGTSRTYNHRIQTFASYPEAAGVGSNGDIVYFQRVVDGTDAGLLSLYAANVTPPSSKRYKNIIDEMVPDDMLDSILALPMYRFRYNETMESVQDTTKIHFGFMAEDMQAICDSVCYYMHDEETGEEIVDGINYPMLVPHLFALCKRQQTKLDAQQEQINKLIEDIKHLKGE